LAAVREFAAAAGATDSLVWKWKGNMPCRYSGKTWWMEVICAPGLAKNNPGAPYTNLIFS